MPQASICHFFTAGLLLMTVSGVDQQQQRRQRVGVVGASLGGLAAANVFVQLGYEVHVFERSETSFEDKGSGLGFVDVDLWQRLRGGRMTRRGRQASRQQGAFYYGDHWKFLYAGLPDGTVRFGTSIDHLGDTPYNRPTINGEAYDLAIIADGGWSGLQRYVTETQPKYAGYVGWRGGVKASEVPWFDAFGIYKNGIYDTIVLPLAKDNGETLTGGGAFIATPEAEIVRPEVGAARHGTANDEKRAERKAYAAEIPDWFLPLYQQKFGGHAGGDLARLFATIVRRGELKAYPQFEYVAERVTTGRLVLVGDAAHMASPRTAAGAHTAVLDAVALREAFATVGPHEIDRALAVYGPDGAERARQLYMRSREVSRAFVPAGGISAVVSPSAAVCGGR